MTMEQAQPQPAPQPPAPPVDMNVAAPGTATITNAVQPAPQPPVDWPGILEAQARHLAQVAQGTVHRAEELPQLQAVITNGERLLAELYALKGRALDRLREHL